MKKPMFCRIEEGLYNLLRAEANNADGNLTKMLESIISEHFKAKDTTRDSANKPDKKTSGKSAKAVVPKTVRPIQKRIAGYTSVLPGDAYSNRSKAQGSKTKKTARVLTQ